MVADILHGAVEGTHDEERKSKIASVAQAQDELVAELVGLGTTMSAAMDALPGFVPCGHAFGVVVEGLAASAGHVAPEDVRQLTEAVHARSEHVSDHRGVPQGAAVDVRAQLAAAPADDQVAAMRAQLLVSLQGMAPYAMRSMELGVMSDEIDVALARGLAVLGKQGADPMELHDALMLVSGAARAALALL